MFLNDYLAVPHIFVVQILPTYIMDYKIIAKGSIATALLFLALAFTSQPISAQDTTLVKVPYNTTNLQSLKHRFVSEFNKEQQHVAAYTKANGISVKAKLANGNVNELQFIATDGTPIYYTTHNTNVSEGSRASALYTGGLLDLGVSGENKKIGVWDAGIALTNHQEFDTRVTVGDATSEVNSHATMVAGTIAASGKKNKAKGVAYSAQIVSHDWSRDKIEVVDAASNGLLLSNHSYGINPERVPDWYFGAYIKVAQDWDEIMFNAPYYLMVTAAGNAQKLKYNEAPVSGTAFDGNDLMLGASVSKNGITVAAANTQVDANGFLSYVKVANYSSFGPTDDGRIKPDIAGQGSNVYTTNSSGVASYYTTSGTSIAAPGVTATLLLLQDFYEVAHQRPMKAATLKGLALHTADDVDAPGPDYKMGWGILNAKTAAEAIINENYSSSIEEYTLSNGEILSIDVRADQLSDLVASISWTDPSGTVVTSGTLNGDSAVLVNDLDIRITNDNTTFYPWKLKASSANNPAVKGDNKVDPFEKISIENPKGMYTITVSHKGNLAHGKQDFSLVVTGVSFSDCTVETPVGLDYTENENSVVLEWTGSDASLYEVEYKEISATDWQVVYAETPTLVLSNLKENMTYVVRVSGICTTYAVSEVSETLTFTYKKTQTDDANTDDSKGDETDDVVVSPIDTSDAVFEFTVYPNPTSDVIRFKEGVTAETTYQIVSLGGNVVKKGSAKTQQINVSDLKTGFYIVSVFDLNGKRSAKFIKN